MPWNRWWSEDCPTRHRHTGQPLCRWHPGWRQCHPNTLLIYTIAVAVVKSEQEIISRRGAGGEETDLPNGSEDLFLCSEMIQKPLFAASKNKEDRRSGLPHLGIFVPYGLLFFATLFRLDIKT